MRTIGELLKHDGRIYVWLPSQALRELFMQNAEREGFRFGDGVKPTERETDDCIAVNRDWTINYLGYMGHMAFHTGTHVGTNDGTQKTIRIDYGAYIAGREDYVMAKSPLLVNRRKKQIS